jgi:hypothetical protein
VAPTTGNYIFRGLADDFVSVYLSNVTGSAQLNYSSPLIQSTGWQQSGSYSDYYYESYPNLTSVPIALNAGDARYLEVYHLNVGGASGLLISVEVPNTLTNLPNLVYSVQNIAIQPSVQPEIITFTQTGATGGTLNFHTVVQTGLVITYNVNYTVPWNATVSQFTSMLNAFQAFYGLNFVVTLQTFDVNGNAVNVGSTAYQYVWTVTVNSFRSPTQTSQTFTTGLSNLTSTNASVTPTIVIATTQTHSPPVSGTFTLALGN